MAYEMNLRGGGGEVKVRNPWAVALLPLITLGIYHLVWWYRVNRELRDYGRARGYDLGQNPTNSLLALFPGSLIIVPALVSYWRGTKRIMGAARVAGTEPVNGWLSIVLYLLLAPAYWGYLQSSLNSVWEVEAEPLPGSLPPPQSDAMPPRLSEEPGGQAQEPGGQAQEPPPST